VEIPGGGALPGRVVYFVASGQRKSARSHAHRRLVELSGRRFLTADPDETWINGRFEVFTEARGVG